MRIGLDIIGVAAFTVLAGLRMAQVLEGELLVIPLVLQAGMVAVLLLVRRNNTASVPFWQTILSWIIALLPLAMRLETEESVVLMILSSLGVVTSLWALAVLGRSFGIAPADRGLVARGPYHLVRHPMYAGELLSYLAVTAGSISLWNCLVLIAIITGLFLRIGWEERMIKGYADYAAQTRWRLFPGVW